MHEPKGKNTQVWVSIESLRWKYIQLFCYRIYYETDLDMENLECSFSLEYVPLNLSKLQHAINQGKLKSDRLITMRDLRNTGIVSRHLRDGIKLLARVILNSFSWDGLYLKFWMQIPQMSLRLVRICFLVFPRAHLLFRKSRRAIHSMIFKWMRKLHILRFSTY